MSDSNHSEQLNILVLPAWFPSDAQPILGSFVREQAKAAARYNQVTILHASRLDTMPRWSWRIASDALEEGVRTVRVEWRKPPFPRTALIYLFWVLAAAYRHIKRSGFRPDIIHVHNYSMALPGLFLGKLFRVPMVITEHTSQFHRGSVQRQWLVDVKGSFRRAAMILPVSAFLQESMQSYGIVGEFRVIPNTYDSEIFLPDKAESPPIVKSDIPRLLTVALLTEPKGIPVLLRAVQIVKGKGSLFLLDIVGDGAMKTDFETLSAELGLQDEVIFHGLKEKPDVARFMQDCDFYVQASLWETFGVTIVEAMACGKPIIGTQIPAIEDKVSDRIGILVPVDDECALAAAIEEMLESYGSYDPMEIASSAFDRFGHEAVGKALDEVYKEVCRAG